MHFVNKIILEYPKNRSFRKSIAFSKFTRFSKNFGILMCGRIGCLASRAVTWTVSECNSFEIGFGFPWDCFDLGPITLLASKSGSLALRFGLSFTENFHHEYPQPNSAYISIFRRVCIQMCSSFSHDFACLTSWCVPSNNRMMKKKRGKKRRCADTWDQNDSIYRSTIDIVFIKRATDRTSSWRIRNLRQDKRERQY